MEATSRFALAYGLDWLVGDPHRLPHPVRWMGWSIAQGERLLRRSDAPAWELARGGMLTCAVVGLWWALARAAVRWGGPAAEVFCGWTVLATRTLLRESNAVLAALEDADIATARTRLAMIVGRDTETLNESEILRAVIETLAESLCDGIVAPMLYLAVGGPSLAMAFKAVSTMDSMIGHREPPYLYFGRAAARLDDAANFVPARFAALAICGVAPFVGGCSRSAWRVWMRDGEKHPSPNAGHPEAAMAGALGVRLGGQNYYGGQPSPKPLLGEDGRPPVLEDAKRAVRIVGVASVAAFGLCCIGLRFVSGRKAA